MEKKHKISIVLDNIRSALNVGAIFRTCDAVGVEMLYLCGITAYPPHNRIPKTALGATKSVKWEHHNESFSLVKKLSKKYPIASIEITEKSVSLWKTEFKQNSILVLGNEINGVNPKILEVSDSVVHIPMYGIKNSLNVATSCGIAAYEAARQLNR